MTEQNPRIEELLASWRKTHVLAARGAIRREIEALGYVLVDTGMGIMAARHQLYAPGVEVSQDREG